MALKLLHRSSEPKINIIAVHGLRGDSDTTWRHENQSYWLKDFLPSHLSSSNIWTYDYKADSTYLESNTSGEVANRIFTFAEAFCNALADNGFGELPNIFLGHGLGGIVIKRTLTHLATRESERNFRRVLENTRHIMFFETPHKGLDLEYWRTHEGQKLGLTAKEISLWSTTLSDYEPHFAEVCSKYGIGMTSVLAQDSRTLPEASVRLNLRTERVVWLNQASESIGKFNSEEDENFITIRNRLGAVVSEASDRAIEPSWDERKCLVWVDALDDYGLEYTSIRKQRQQGTCEWILNEAVYKTWKGNKKSQPLWIRGISGSGKTVLSSKILDDLLDSSIEHNLRVLYFFCKNGDQERDNPLAVARNLVNQLIQPKLRESIDTLKQATLKDKSEKCKSFQRMWDVFCTLLSAQQGVIYIIIDALDECRERLGFLDAIRRLDPKEFRAKFLITARPEPDLDQAFHNCPIISMGTNNVIQDIWGFIARKAQISPKLKPFKDKIITTVSQKAEGMFRYASLMLDELNKPSALTVDEILGPILQGLNGIYQWIIDDLGKKSSFSLCKMVLMWVAMAQRPLSVKEMALAFVTPIKGGGREFNPDEYVLPKDPKEDIINACGPLIEIIRGNKLQFTHMSVKDFLLQKPQGLDKSSDFVKECLIQEIPAHISITTTCVTQLLSTYFEGSLTSGDKAISYCVAGWIHHARQIELIGESEEDCPVWDLAERLLMHGFLFERWRNFYGVDSSYLPIHLAASHSLVAIIKRLLQKDSRLAGLKMAGSGRTPLQLAVSNGSPMVERRVVKRAMEVLLEKGAKVNARSEDGRAALHYAAETGLEENLKLLLGRGASINLKDKNGETPLQYAAKLGHIRAAEVLLDHKADINSLNVEKKTPLHLAAKATHIEMVELLLGRKANIHSLDLWGESPLHVVVQSDYTYYESFKSALKLIPEQVALVESREVTMLVQGLEDHTKVSEVVKLLLKRGANANLPNIRGQSSLHHAASAGPVQVVEILINYKANMNLQDMEGRTPLHCAVMEDQLYNLSVGNTSSLVYFAVDVHAEVVKLLLDRGANIDSRDGQGRTPLHLAAHAGRAASAEVLLSKKADVHSLDNHGETALHRAADGECKVPTKNFTQMNRASGCEIPLSYLDNDGDTALYRTTVQTKVNFRMNWAPGCEISFPRLDNHGDTVLHCAADGECKVSRSELPLPCCIHDLRARVYNLAYARIPKVVKLLLRKGADINAQYHDGGTPLHRAAKTGYVDMVNVLLECGADINSRDKEGRMPVHSVTSSKNAVTLQILLDKGADVDSQTKDGSTPLHYAIHKDGGDTVKLLIERRANVSCQDSDGRTPLHIAAGQGETQLVTLLLEGGADINAQDYHGATPLHNAAVLIECSTVKVLIDHGADISARDYRGFTPATYTVLGQGWKEMIQRTTGSFQLLGFQETIRRISERDELLRGNGRKVMLLLLVLLSVALIIIY